MKTVLVFLNGTVMSGQPNELVMEGARLLGPARTAPDYRFFSVRDEFPGLVPVDQGGVSIEGELWEITEDVLLNSLLPTEPPELELGNVTLVEGTGAKSMLLRLDRVSQADDATDIARFGGWRAYRRWLSRA